MLRSPQQSLKGLEAGETVAGNLKVFCSHNSVDKPRVKEVAEKLAEAGINPWVDGWEILPGDSIVAKSTRDWLRATPA
jgi:hypothetical protein